MKKIGIIASVLVVMLGVIFSLASINASGICISTMHRFTNEELVAITKKAAYQTYTARVRSGYYLKEKSATLNSLVYSSIDEFLLLNPNCCGIVSEDELRVEDKVGLVRRISGEFRSWTSSSFFIEDRVVESQRWLVSNCGHISTSVY